MPHALLVLRGTSFPKTHDIRFLTALIPVSRQYGSAFSCRPARAYVAAKETDYWLYLQPSDFGEAFRLAKIVPTADGPAELGEVYHVVFEDQHNHTCECKGFLRPGHCKHIDSLKALREHGKI